MNHYDTHHGSISLNIKQLYLLQVSKCKNGKNC